MTPNGALVYVTHFNSDTVSVIDTSTQHCDGYCDCGRPPLWSSSDPKWRICLYSEPDQRNRLSHRHCYQYCYCYRDCGDLPAGAAVTPDSAFVYVTNVISNTVSVIDTSTNTVIDTVTVGGGPRGVAVTPDGASVYVANEMSDTVSVIDTSTNTVIDTVTVGDRPVAFGMFI